MSTAARTKLLVTKYGRVIAAVLVVVSVAAAAGAYLTYTDPDRETVVEQRNRQRVSASVTTSAVVTGDTSLYDRGRVLQDKSVYLLNASPNLNVTVRTSVPDGRTVRVSHRLVLRNVASRGGEVFWQSRRVLFANRTETTTSGSTTASATVNMSKVQNDIAERQSEIGVGAFESELVMTVSYRTPRYEGELRATSPVVFAGGGYWLENEMAPSTVHTTQTSRTVVDRNVVLVRALAAVAVLALAGVVALGYWHVQSPDISAIESELSTARYSEWISSGQFPTDTGKQYIYIDSLEDLVDVAIDSNKRVIHDTELEAYSVLDGNLVYYHAKEPTIISSWLDISEGDDEGAS